jgi:hypothetical protein
LERRRIDMPESRINVNNLSPYQLAIQGVVGKGKNALKNITADQLGRIADSVFGSAPVPPGSQITYQDATTVHWTDPEGYEHVATRNLDGRDVNAGVWREQTNRPAILPPPSETQSLQKSLTELAQRLTGASPTLAELDPATKAALAAISAAEQARLQEQFDRESGDLLARLYGSGVQRSSIAGENLSQMLQAQNLVTQQQQSDAATRELQAREYLTNVGQQSNNSLLGLLNSLLGQQTQRDIATGGLNLDSAKLAEQARQFGLNSELAQQDADLRLAAARQGSDFFGNALQGIAGSLVNFGLGQIPALGGAFRNLLGGRGSGQIYGAGSAWPQN